MSIDLSEHEIKEFMKGTSYIHNDIMNWMMTGFEGVSRRYILTLIQLITVKELIDISVKNIIELNQILHGKSKTVQTYKKHFRILEKNNLIIKKDVGNGCHCATHQNT